MVNKALYVRETFRRWIWEFYHNERLLRADPCCRSVIKEFVHAFSCAYVELWMHLGSLKSTKKARVALGCASSYSYTFFVLSKLPAYIIQTRYTHAKHEQILNSLTTTYSLGVQQSISESTWAITRSSLANILLQIIKLNSFSEKN